MKKPTKYQRLMKLPSGNETRSQRRYITVWRRLSKPIGKAVGERGYGYDPGIIFDGGLSLNNRQAIRLYEALTGEKWHE